MITKTTTVARFLYNDTSDEFFQFGKEHYDNALQQFVKPIADIELDVFLERLLVHKDLIVADNVANIEIVHTYYYDTSCFIDFSEKTIGLLNELGARLSTRAQRNFEGETLYQVLDKMRERPALYIGEYSITALYHFVQGFFMACDGGTKEVPNFDGFNNFVGKYYGEYTTAGWKNLILSDHFGNEQEALRQFYTLLDAFRAMRNAPSARDIVHRLLYVAFIHFRGESHEIGKNLMQDDDDIVKNASEIRAELWKINRVADLLHNATNPMKRATYSFEYDEILQNIFSQAFNYEYLHQYILKNAPKTTFYEYVIYQDENEVKLSKNIENIEKKQVLKTFFAINEAKAEELKTSFLENK